MGIIICFILIIAFITWLSYISTGDKRQAVKLSNAGAGALASTIIIAVITTVMFLDSYNSYIGLAKKLATIEQYKESIELYADKGVQEFQPGSTGSKELTDLKYNNYQTQIGQMIRDMRDTIVDYNEELTGKLMRKNNWFFSWIIIVDENMKPIKMADYIK